MAINTAVRVIAIRFSHQRAPADGLYLGYRNEDGRISGELWADVGANIWVDLAFGKYRRLLAWCQRPRSDPRDQFVVIHPQCLWTIQKSNSTGCRIVPCDTFINQSLLARCTYLTNTQPFARFNSTQVKCTFDIMNGVPNCHKLCGDEKSTIFVFIVYNCTPGRGSIEERMATRARRNLSRNWRLAVVRRGWVIRDLAWRCCLVFPAGENVAHVTSAHGRSCAQSRQCSPYKEEYLGLTRAELRTMNGWFRFYLAI
jgi:hypothetical protein